MLIKQIGEGFVHTRRKGFSTKSTKIKWLILWTCVHLWSLLKILIHTQYFFPVINLVSLLLLFMMLGKVLKLFWTFYTQASFLLCNLWSAQSHYIEVAQGDIFMEQKMWFGLVLGPLATLKKNWGADYE